MNRNDFSTQEIEVKRELTDSLATRSDTVSAVEFEKQWGASKQLALTMEGIYHGCFSKFQP